MAAQMICAVAVKEPQFPSQFLLGLLMVYTLLYYFLAKFLTDRADGSELTTFRATACTA